jgi:hypothetical protein
VRIRICVAAIVLTGQASFAQQTIQQPVVGTTSVNTTVSVPDRGTTFLGGVSSAQSGRSQYGPLPIGPSSGLTRQSSSMSVSVYIHDLQAMDEALLNSASSSAEPRRAGTGMTSLKAVPQPPAEPVASPAEKASKFEQLARKADEAGKPGVAKLHWQMAAKYGSKAAEEKLAEMSHPSTPQSSRTAKR